MRKRMLYFVVMILLTLSFTNGVYGQIIEPTLGIKYLTASPLRKYYDTDVHFDYGLTFTMFPHKSDTGLFLKYVKAKIHVYDENYYHPHIEFSNSIFIIGLQRNIKTNCYRVGISKHFDNLGDASDNDNRIGFFISLGRYYRINKNIIYFIDAEFEFEDLHVPNYCAYSYSRHQAYLAGKKFNTGGISLDMGLSFHIN